MAKPRQIPGIRRYHIQGEKGVIQLEGGDSVSYQVEQRDFGPLIVITAYNEQGEEVKGYIRMMYDHRGLPKIYCPRCLRSRDAVYPADDDMWLCCDCYDQYIEQIAKSQGE